MTSLVVYHEAKDKDSNEENNSMGIIRNKCTPQTARNHISRNDQGYQEASSIHVHAAQRTDDLATSQHQASTHQHVGQDAVEQIGDVGDPSMSRHHYLGESMGTWRIALDLDCYQREEQDLESSHSTIPHRSTDAVAVCERTACE